MRLAIAGFIVLAVSVLPLLAVGLLDPDANPIGLGLLAMLGVPLAGLLLAAALLRGLWRLLRR